MFVVCKPVLCYVIFLIGVRINGKMHRGVSLIAKNNILFIQIYQFHRQGGQYTIMYKNRLTVELTFKETDTEAAAFKNAKRKM